MKASATKQEHREECLWRGSQAAKSRSLTPAKGAGIRDDMFVKVGRE
jgi:hypothetical protein